MISMISKNEVIKLCICNDDIDNLKLLIQYDTIQLVANQTIYFYTINEELLIWNACLKMRAKNILEFIVNHCPEIIPNDIDTSSIEQKDIQKYNFIKMLINRNLIDIPN
jgi:hypothetical protein